MKKSDQLNNLFAAIGARKLDDAIAVAEEICNQEEFAGHTTVARHLRSSLHSRPNGAFSGTRNSVVATALKRIVKDAADLTSVRLRQKCRAEIDDFVVEWRNREKLELRGLPIRSKILFHGPPGCGKSLTSAAIGKELGLPAYMVRFDAVIGSYLGQTAANIRQIFQFAEETACVVVIDELDALGTKRGNPRDVGELDRIVIALMQELEHSQPAGIIVASSNLPMHLDDALWRRFDLVLEFPNPSKTELVAFSKIVASKFDLRFSDNLRSKIQRCRSYAEAEAAVQSEARKNILKDLSKNGKG